MPQPDSKATVRMLLHLLGIASTANLDVDGVEMLAVKTKAGEYAWRPPNSNQVGLPATACSGRCTAGLRDQPVDMCVLDHGTVHNIISKANAANSRPGFDRAA